MQDHKDKNQNARALRAPNEMSDEEWLEALLDLNPWARGFDFIAEGESPAFVAARRRATLERYNQGVDQWNAWATGIILLKHQKPALSHAYWTEPFGDFTKSDFGFVTFHDDADFAEMIFPTAATFKSTTFAKNANFNKCIFLGNLSLASAIFSGAFKFSEIDLRGSAIFDHALFMGHAELQTNCGQGFFSFNASTFRNHASFNFGRVNGIICFKDSKFQSSASLSGHHLDRLVFETTSFQGPVLIHHLSIGNLVSQTCTYENVFNLNACRIKEALFQKSDFHGRVFVTIDDSNAGQHPEAAIFGNVQYFESKFIAPALFRGVRFVNDAIFSNVESTARFRLEACLFQKTPDFTDATFHEPPRLDDCEVPDPLNEFQSFEASADDPRPRNSFLLPAPFPIWRVARDADEHARFRKLRKMAADAKDHENELKFNGYEIAARRFWVDHPYKNPGRFWLGWLYGLFSDYGQSVARPVLAWSALVMIFWMILFVFTPDHTKTAHGSQCHEQYVGEVGTDSAARWFAGPASQALFISLRNASVIGQPDPSVSRRMYGCLYGLESMQKRGGTANNGADATRPVPWPVIPPVVTAISAIQSVLSAIFLFLTGLGLRNTFRMK